MQAHFLPSYKLFDTVKYNVFSKEKHTLYYVFDYDFSRKLYVTIPNHAYVW